MIGASLRVYLVISSIKPSNMLFLLFENLERALLMLNAKQGNDWYHFF